MGVRAVVVEGGEVDGAELSVPHLVRAVVPGVGELVGDLTTSGLGDEDGGSEGSAGELGAGGLAVNALDTVDVEKGDGLLTRPDSVNAGGESLGHRVGPVKGTLEVTSRLGAVEAGDADVKADDDDLGLLETEDGHLDVSLRARGEGGASKTARVHDDGLVLVALVGRVEAEDIWALAAGTIGGLTVLDHASVEEGSDDGGESDTRLTSGVGEEGSAEADALSGLHDGGLSC